MDAAGEERLGSWICEVIETLVETVNWREEGFERRALGQGGLTVNTRSGAWYQHGAGKGGYRVLPLIQLLKGCTYRAAVEWGDAWLRSHPGTGAGVTGGGDDAEIDSAAITQDLLDKLEPPAGTHADTYLRSRGIEIADFSKLPVKFLPFARTGESAIAGILTSHGRTVAVQLGYLDAHGRKSLVSPARRRFNLEKARDAIFELPAPENATEILADKVISEGAEDFLSVALMGRSWNLVGLPGIGALRHLPVKKGERIVVIRDGDEPGSPSDRDLTAGIDHLILEGALVQVTETPLEEDANSVLSRDGLAGLMTLIGTASNPAELSEDGEITRLSRLDHLEYERQRKTQAEKLGMRLGALDKEVQRRRRNWGEGDTAEEPAGQGRRVVIPVVDPWPNPVDGSGLLDAITTGIRQYLVLEPHQADAITLFSVFTHAFDAFEVAPKLVVKSAQKRSGKTRQLEVLNRLVAKPIGAAGITASALRRMIERHTPTLLLDEFDTVVKGSPEMAEALRGVLNSGFDRASANMIISVPMPGGAWEERQFSTWCPQVLAGIGAIPDTVADRCIAIEMKRKLRTEKVRRLRSKDGEDLRILARKAARWAEDHKILLGAADPPTPSQLDDRAADAWSPLLAIADAASLAWGKRARAAAILLNGSKEDPSEDTELFADIRLLFGENTKALSSDQLVAGLIQLEGHLWADINKGRPLTKNGLARRLKPYHISPGTIRLTNNSTPKGYKLQQFQDAFERYLSLPPLFPPDSTVTPPQPAENKGFQADSEPPQPTPCGGLKTGETASVSAACGSVVVENGGKGGCAEKGADFGAPSGRKW